MSSLRLITVASVILGTADLLLFHRLSSGASFTQFVVVLTALNFLIWILWAGFIYPHFFSPLRHLPQPKGGWPIIRFGGSGFQRPAGQRFLEFIETIPNEGIIRVPGFFNSEGILLANSEALAEVLVRKSYDYEKPTEVRNFLREILGDGLILTEGDEHKFQRKHLLPAFSFRHIKELIPVFWSRSIAMREQIIKEMQETGEPDGQSVVELNHWASKVTLDIIGVAGLGRDFRALSNADDPLVKNYDELLEPTSEKLVYFVCNLIFGRRLVSWMPWRLNERLMTTTGTLREFCLEFLQQKKEVMKMESAEQLDILSLLIKSNCFSDETLIDQLLTFIAAGHETTSSAFAWAAYLLAKNPEIQTRLREEVRSSLPHTSSPDPTYDLATILDSLPLLHGVTNEVLRLYPSVPSTLRTTIRETYISNQVIPLGTRIQIVPWAINRSTTLWGADALEFSPERWIDKDGTINNHGGMMGNNYCNLTFLHGSRSCIGEKFARSELKALVAVFVGGFEWEMADKSEVSIPAGVITTKPKNGMKLRLKELDVW
ncbi:hypothetical protein HYFRA_00010710 [Hymenoscyphus fraxineus]|uniref:Cytochrome P450 n=1 Tax=Hymenoscyphus fraxineus TaxID=746836 RepID=A0A9N9L496_9HELO|nr:hypothetical protein HYFRA_00010710 [Hymenoscyphus fraxineus]